MTADDGLTADFADLGRLLLAAQAKDRFDPQQVVVVAARCVPNTQHASLTMVTGKQAPETIAMSHEVCAKVDALQYEVGEGPCLEAIRESDIARANDLATDSRWPEFGRRVVELTPIRSMLGVRLFLDDNRRGALNFYAQSPGAFLQTDIGIGAMFASFASLALQRESAQRKVANLEIALESSRHIGAAMGILMARQLMTPEQAFEQLRSASQHLHRKLRDIADEVVHTGQLPSE
jgi:hypothetical protein